MGRAQQADAYWPQPVQIIARVRHSQQGASWAPPASSTVVARPCLARTTLPDLATAFLLSLNWLFIVGNFVIAFLVGESRLIEGSAFLGERDTRGAHE
jgi:hypothetical protein